MITWISNNDWPHTPFVGWLLLWDSIRVFCILAGVVIVASAPWAMGKCHVGTQRARFMAFSFWSLLVVVSGISRLGDIADIRLFLQLTAACYALYGMWGFRVESPVGGRQSRHDS